MFALVIALLGAEPPPPAPVPPATTVAGVDVNAKPALIQAPHWIRRPSGADVADVYPPLALQGGLNGHSTMECVVSVQGDMENCKIIEETPLGRGFGDAELRLARRFKLAPTTENGAPVTGAKIVIPFGWSVR